MALAIPLLGLAAVTGTGAVAELNPAAKEK